MATSALFCPLSSLTNIGPMISSNSLSPVSLPNFQPGGNVWPIRRPEKVRCDNTYNALTYYLYILAISQNIFLKLVENSNAKIRTNFSGEKDALKLLQGPFLHSRRTTVDPWKCSSWQRRSNVVAQNNRKGRA
jgi:hypothetical protein